MPRRGQGRYDRSLGFKQGSLTTDADGRALGARPHIRHSTRVDLHAARLLTAMVCGAPPVGGLVDDGSGGRRWWCLCHTLPKSSAVNVIDADWCAFGARPHILCFTIARVELVLPAARLVLSMICRARPIRLVVLLQLLTLAPMLRRSCVLWALGTAMAAIPTAPSGPRLLACIAKPFAARWWRRLVR